MKHSVVVSLHDDGGRLVTAQPFHATTFLGDALTELLLNREPHQIIELLDDCFEVNYIDVCVVGGRRHVRRRREDCFKLIALPLYQFPMINHHLRLFSSFKIFHSDTLRRLLAWNLQCSQQIHDGLIRLIYTRVKRRCNISILEAHAVRFLFIRWGKSCLYLSKGRYRVFVNILPLDVNRSIARLLFQLWLEPLLQIHRDTCFAQQQ
jgi:hypothetical protein